jgi:hypothetical protein
MPIIHHAPAERNIPRYAMHGSRGETFLAVGCPKNHLHWTETAGTTQRLVGMPRDVLHCPHANALE